MVDSEKHPKFDRAANKKDNKIHRRQSKTNIDVACLDFHSQLSNHGFHKNNKRVALAQTMVWSIVNEKPNMLIVGKNS